MISYYVVNLHPGKTMKDILKDFNQNQKKRDDHFLVSKMSRSQISTRDCPVYKMLWANDT